MSSWVAETEEPGQEQNATASHHVERDSDPGKELGDEVNNYQGENRINVIVDVIKEEANDTQVINILFIIMATVNWRFYKSMFNITVTF